MDDKYHCCSLQFWFIVNSCPQQYHRKIVTSLKKKKKKVMVPVGMSLPTISHVSLYCRGTRGGLLRSVQSRPCPFPGHQANAPTDFLSKAAMASMPGSAGPCLPPTNQMTPMLRMAPSQASVCWEKLYSNLAHTCSELFQFNSAKNVIHKRKFKISTPKASTASGSQEFVITCG